MRESSWEGGESYQEPEVGDPLSLEGKKILIKEEKEDPPTNQREATSATIEEQGEEYWQQQYDEVRRLEEQLMAIQGFKEMDRQESIQNGWELKFKEVAEDLTKAKEDLTLWKDKHDQVERSLQQQYNETKKLEEQLAVAKDSQIRDATEISNLKDELQHRTTELNDCRKQRRDEQNQAKADIEDNYRRKIIRLQDSLEKANLKAAQLVNSLEVRELEIRDLTLPLPTAVSTAAPLATGFGGKSLDFGSKTTAPTLGFGIQAITTATAAPSTPSLGFGLKTTAASSVAVKLDFGSSMTASSVAPLAFGGSTAPSSSASVAQSISSATGSAPSSEGGVKPIVTSVFGGSVTSTSSAISASDQKTIPKPVAACASAPTSATSSAATTTTASGSIFGGSSTGAASVFGGSSGSSSVFGGAAPNKTAGSVFGTPPAASAAAATAPTASVFGGAPASSSPFDGTKTSTPSSSQPASTAPASSASSIFGGAASQSSVFGGKAPASSGSVFGGSATTAPAPASSAPSAFSSQPSSTSSVFGGQPSSGAKANIKNLQESVEKGVEQRARCFNLQQDNEKLKKKLEDLHQQVQELKRELNLRGNSESRTCDSGCSNGKPHSGGNGRRSEKPKRKDPEGQRFESRPTNHNQAPSQRSDNHGRSGQNRRPHSAHRRRQGDSPDGSDPSSPESSNNYYADSGEDDLYKRSKGRSANFSTHPKVRQKIALLQAELWSTREDIHEDYVLSQEDVATLSSDVLRMHMRNEEHHQYKKDIARIKMKLEKLKIRFSDELSLVDRNSIEIALLSCNNMKKDVINTRDRIREAAKAKNVKLEINRKNGGRKPTFSGDPRETTIVEFLSQVDSYADRCGIPYEELGLLIKNQCKKRAKEVVLEEFGIVDNPNPEEIKTCLKKHFGHKNMVMSEIVSVHLSIGVIPEPVKYGENRKKNLQSAKDILDKTRKHLEMIRKSAPFRPRPPAEDPLDEFALHDEYTQILIGVLPSRERNEYYKNHTNHHGEAKLYYIIDLLEGIKSTVQDIVIRGSLMANPDDSDQEDEPENNEGGGHEAYEEGEQMYESDEGEVYCKEEPSTPDHQGEEGEPDNGQPDGDIWPQECMEECDEW